jgi:hypothetical protein
MKTHPIIKVTASALLFLGVLSSLYSSLGFKKDLTSYSPETTNSFHWKTTIELGGGFVLTTFLTAEKTKNHISIRSPKNADVRIFGRFKSYMGRLLGKLPRKGALIRIDGTMNGDSVSGEAFVAVMGTLQFKGTLRGDSISGDLVKNDTLKIGKLSGKLSSESRLDYTQLHAKTLTLVEEHIYNKEVLKSEGWTAFQQNFNALCARAQDDLELFIGFSTYRSTLPFSHFYLLMEEAQDSDTSASEQAVHFEEKPDKVGYLKIDNFSTSAAELKEIMPHIVEKAYPHLIVDLRNNPGGGVEAAYALAEHLVNTTMDIGYFTTNKFSFQDFNSNTLSQLPELEPETTDGFIAYLMQQEGAKMIIKGHQQAVFEGQLYLLVNSRTASTCEPIAYVLKTRENVTVIGENTAGAMLSANYFDLYDKYKLVIPIADFFTIDGTRLDGVGVQPDVVTASDSALERALLLIQEQ